jgi:type I restriction enzyme S subunit
MHYLNFFNYRDYVTGTTRLKLNQGNLRKFIIPLPKYELQIKIVSKIEELFSQLDAGQASLERARVNLRRYRQSLLKAAFSGELTRAWREEHKNDLEPANELLNRIHTERHASHKVILYQKSKKRSETKTQEYALPSNGKNDVIPKEWAWGTIEIFSKPEKNSIKRGPFGSSIKKAYFVEEGYKVYQQGNVINDDFEFGTYYLNEERYKELEDFKIESGDILISCSGTIGRIAQVPNQFRPGVINQALLKISLDPKVINPKYFIWMFREAVEDILQNSVQGVAIQNIASVKVLKSIPFPLPPLTEQDQLVSEIERNFSIIDELIISIIRIEKRRSLLKNSILEKAFSGQLI